MPSQALYPMRLGGGAFLICMGFGLAAATCFHGGGSLLAIVMGGVTGFAAIIALRNATVARWGRPTKKQVRIVIGAIVFEFSAIYLLSVFGAFKGISFLTLWQIILGVVALHFIPMRWSHGPWILALAITILVWIGICVLAGLSIVPLFLGDGILKVAFGAVMAAPLLTRASFETEHPGRRSKT